MNLNHITTVKEANLALEAYDGGWLYLNGLTSTERVKIRKERPDLYINNKQQDDKHIHQKTRTHR